METYPYIQVTGGKFHQPVEATRDRLAWFREPLLVKCNRTVKALNVFTSRADALAYTGGRESYLCSQCENKS